MERGRLSLQHIIHNPFNVQGDDGPASFVGLQEEAVVGVVVEEILGEGSGTEGVLQDLCKVFYYVKLQRAIPLQCHSKSCSLHNEFA